MCNHELRSYEELNVKRIVCVQCGWDTSRGKSLRAYTLLSHHERIRLGMKTEMNKQVKELKFADIGFAGKEETPVQKANRLGVPLIPKKDRIPFQEPNPVIAVCGQCGHEVRSMDHRSCPQGECPFGSNVTLN